MSRSEVSLVYDPLTYKYVAKKQRYQMALFQYKLPRGSAAVSVSGSDPGYVYPINTQVFSNIDASFNVEPSFNNEITFPKGDYILEAYTSLYHNYQNRSIGIKYYIAVVDPSSVAVDLSGACSSNGYFFSGNNQSDWRMNEHGDWTAFFSLTERSTIQIKASFGASNTHQLGIAANLNTTSTSSEQLPEIYGSFKFIKLN